MAPRAPQPWWRDMVETGDHLQYIAVRNRVAAQIFASTLRVGDRLPSERQLEEGFGAARGTIREALNQLEAEGLIYRRDRSGWYVSPPPIVYDPTRWEGFMGYVEAQGRTPKTETLSKQEIPATPYLAGLFGVALESPLFAIRRLRSIDGRAVLVERIMVDPTMAPGLLEHSLDLSLTSVLKSHYGVSVSRNKVSMKPFALLGDDAETLRVRSGAPGLSVIRVSFDPAGRIVEYDEESWRHDSVTVCVDIRVNMGSE